MNKVRIGGASGFWGDSSVGPAQLVAHGNVDFLVFDYLAELTMSILAASRARNPELGYATDFVTALKPLLKDISAQGIRVISNAGGVNPRACADALSAACAEAGVSLRVAVVDGDDVMPLVDALRSEAGGQTIPAKLMTANAYLGAQPIRQALDAGAQIVITGRCVDSAVTLGALMHSFGWSANDLDLLAQGSLAGHIIECGCQATGGLHTDWQDVPDWPNIGYPVIECEADGRFTVSKPPATGGLVNVATVSEQLLYEIGDPARYVLPDVVCDFTSVEVAQSGENRVSVSGAKGLAPTPHYKVSATWMDGYRCTAQLTIIGLDAARKAQRTGEAILARTRTLLAQAGLPDFTRTHIEALGAEAAYGPHSVAAASREVVLQVAVMHPSRAALEIFAREIAPAGTSWSPGTTGAAGRPSPSPCIRQHSFLLEKARVTPGVWMDGVRNEVSIQSATPGAPDDSARTPTSKAQPASTAPSTTTERVPLVQLSWARSGDKGDISNIGVIARRPEWLPHLQQHVTAEAVAAWLGHLVKGSVTRYDVPGIHAMNFVCGQALDGGGMSSLRNDALGKGMAQILLSMPVPKP